MTRRTTWICRSLKSLGAGATVALVSGLFSPGVRAFEGLAVMGAIGNVAVCKDAFPDLAPELAASLKTYVARTKEAVTPKEWAAFEGG